MLVGQFVGRRLMLSLLARCRPTADPNYPKHPHPTPSTRPPPSTPHSPRCCGLVRIMVVSWALAEFCGGAGGIGGVREKGSSADQVPDCAEPNNRALGTLLVRSFLRSIKVQFSAWVTRDARRCFPSRTKLGSRVYAFVRQENGSFLLQQFSGTKAWMSREGNLDTLKTCLLATSENVQALTSLMLTRKLATVRRELKNLKTRTQVAANEKLTCHMWLEVCDCV